MRRYLVNSTYCIYLLDLKALYFDQSVSTLREVVEEVMHEKTVEVEATLVPFKKASVLVRGNFLSSTDLALLQTSKATDCILVTDDQKLISAAHENQIHALDTPHFIHRLLIEGKWTEEKAIDILDQLKPIYNRGYVIDKVIKDIKNWR